MLKVLHWNILVREVDSKFLEWKYRKDVIVQKIKDLDPDVFSLVADDHFDELEQIFLEYIAIFQNNFDGIIIFVRRRLFKVKSYLGNSVLLRYNNKEFLYTACHLKARPEYKVEDILKSFGTDKVILAGDFSDCPDGFRMDSKNEFTTWNLEKKTVDHIFSRNMEFISSLDLSVTTDQPLPNQDFLSDHIPILCFYTF